MVNGDFLGATNIGVEHDTGLRLTSWAAHIWRPGEQWVLVRPPAEHQRPAPAVSVTGPAKAVAGTSVSFSASASSPVAKYRWTFGDGARIRPGGVLGHGLTTAVRTGRGWVTAPVVAPSGVAADSPLTAVSTGAHQVDVFFVDGHGKLAEAAQDQRGWQVGELPGKPAGNTSLTAVNYLLGRPSTAAGPARLGTAVYYLTGSGQPAVTYAPAGQPWRSAALPGRATKILGADAYQAAGQPSRVFLSGPPSAGHPSSGRPSSGQPRSVPFSLVEARGPGGPWVSGSARALPPSSPGLPPWALWLAASGLAAFGSAATLWLAMRRRTRRPHAPGP